MADDLKIPFLFVPHGEPESPEAAEFKARHPGWFSIPATFVPHARPDRDDSTVRPLERLDASDPPSGEAGAVEPRTGQYDAQASMAASVRAFQRASEVHGDPVSALRALRDRPDAFANSAPVSTQGSVATDPER